jgi:hypothetical protein
MTALKVYEQDAKLLYKTCRATLWSYLYMQLRSCTTVDQGVLVCRSNEK